jgi:hypothetical protein
MANTKNTKDNTLMLAALTEEEIRKTIPSDVSPIKTEKRINTRHLVRAIAESGNKR